MRAQYVLFTRFLYDFSEVIFSEYACFIILFITKRGNQPMEITIINSANITSLKPRVK